ncbi:MAG: outer membrane lipoprotein-sorting protein [Desulfobacteraceae bacterium]|nr:outer membrane lipoprotein-sorting protein [Desulfobacteraceae bacterium]
MKTRLVSFMVIGLLVISGGISADTRSADQRVRDGFEYYRGKSSEAAVEMIIHRPDWRREMKMTAWTRGDADSLIRIESPARDKGNGTLKTGKDMWMYNPKINRVIKLPPSMMSQAWMGSDFSNNDLAKTDSILNDYTHTLDKTEEVDGKQVYWIKSMPRPDAPVIWGMQRIAVREDDIILAQEFYDEDLELVKSMRCYDIKMMGDRLYPVKWRMKKADAGDSYTELIYTELRFMDTLSSTIFTVSNLKNPRR